MASHPAWGAWIEIDGSCHGARQGQSHPAWGAWIEIFVAYGITMPTGMSHPAWGAWIEIVNPVIQSSKAGVAPRMGCVD